MGIALQQRDEVFRIAEGRGRAEIDDRAQRSFGHANELRVGTRGPRWMDAQTSAVQRARAWAGVLRYLDWSGKDVFLAADYDEDHPGRPSVVAVLFALADIGAFFSAIDDMFGRKPIVFYTAPDQN
jgi:hypothetical protein